MSNQTASWLPDKKALEEHYEAYRPSFVILLERLELLLRERILVTSKPTYRRRLKGFPSYYRKLLRIISAGFEPKNEFPVLTDLIGIRVICAFLQDLADVEHLLREQFTILEVERKGADRTFREFGYESTHILLEIPEEIRKDLELPPDLVFEVQIRTILQDAWAEVEHELVYKSEFSPFDLPLKRKLASINASLSLADIIFQEIRDYQNKLNRELDKRRGSFYQQADSESALDLAISGSEDPAVPKQSRSNHPDDTQVSAPTTHPAASAEALSVSAPSVSDEQTPASPYLTGTIDDMILDAIESHNSGNLERATEIYTKIIEQRPNDTVLSVIYKHRGMAHFASSRYEQALDDFRESSRYAPEGFRPYYYIAIVLSVMGREQEAVDNFTRSLELNQFQPYVYFRRAQSHYNLGQYREALNDLDHAVSLGYTKPEQAKLRILIAKKLDIT